MATKLEVSALAQSESLIEKLYQPQSDLLPTRPPRGNKLFAKTKKEQKEEEEKENEFYETLSLINTTRRNSVEKIKENSDALTSGLWECSKNLVDLVSEYREQDKKIKAQFSKLHRKLDDVKETKTKTEEDINTLKELLKNFNKIFNDISDKL